MRVEEGGARWAVVGPGVHGPGDGAEPAAEELGVLRLLPDLRGQERARGFLPGPTAQRDQHRREVGGDSFFPAEKHGAGADRGVAALVVERVPIAEVLVEVDVLRVPRELLRFVVPGPVRAVDLHEHTGEDEKDDINSFVLGHFDPPQPNHRAN